MKFSSRTVSSTCGNAPSVYIPCMSPRNHADCTAILSRHSRSLLAQFGLTPKSKRGLVGRYLLNAGFSCLLLLARRNHAAVSASL
jgi:hypothetical protein